MKPPEPIPDTDGDADDAGSVASSRQGPFHSMPKGHHPAMSLATDYTQSEAPDTFDGASHDLGSNPDGDTGLVNGARREKQRPKHLNIAGTHSAEVTPQKSPHSFRSGFSLKSKNRIQPGHQHLSSNGNSPEFPPSKRPAAPVQKTMGKNYEYFEGNTIFWGGGRFQNARDRPNQHCEWHCTGSTSYTIPSSFRKCIHTLVVADTNQSLEQPTYGIMFRPRYL